LSFILASQQSTIGAARKRRGRGTAGNLGAVGPQINGAKPRFGRRAIDLVKMTMAANARRLRRVGVAP
jgi:hypothetical protein